MSIITIARECGAGGGAIAKELSLRLSALQINKNVLEESLSSYGIDGGWLDKFDEKKPGLLSVFFNSQEVYLLLMKLALLSVVSEAENSVVLGRGAHLLLKDVKNKICCKLGGTENE